MNTIDRQQIKLAAWPAFAHAKCPRCRQGDMFANSMYGFHSQKMNTECSHCHLVYDREPGYFYVAMFVSYAMNVAEMVTVCVATSILTGSMNAWLYVGLALITSVVLSPFNFRYSRVALLHWLTPGLHYRAEIGLTK